MKTITRTLALVVFAASVATAVHASSIGNTYTLHTLSSFTESLVEKGIIPQAYAEKARTFVRMIMRAEATPESVEAMNADKVSVSVSQLIEHANLEFEAGSDIVGPLLLIRNTSSERTTLEGKRYCDVIYRLYNEEDALVYDSATTERCSGTERITFELDAGKVRMFKVTHRQTEYALTKGIYTMEIEFPGYGTGERIITIL